MKIVRLTVLALFVQFTVIEFALAQDTTKLYPVYRITDSIEVNGKGDAALWEKAALLTDFKLPWNNYIAPPTSFRALWNDESLYFLYNVIDHDIIAPGPIGNERSVMNSDRVEIFFMAKGSLDPYYCLELDPSGRILDYEARTYRKFDLYWEWPDTDLSIRTSMQENGYTVEGEIKLSSLRLMGILNDDDTMIAGLYRGDYYHVNNQKTAVRWITWIDPKIEKPDFHIPSTFGTFKLLRETR